MKTVGSVLWRAVVLYLAALAGFAGGVAMPALRVSRTLSHTATSIRTYDYDWLIAVLLVYLLMLVVSTVRRRLRQSWLASTAALVLTAAVVLLFTQLGVKESAL